MDVKGSFLYDAPTFERYDWRQPGLKRGLRALYASFVELCFSVLIICYSILQGLVFRNFINGLLFGVVGISMMQMGWLFVSGCRTNSVLLLKAHAYLTLFYAVVTLVICVALCFCHLFNDGIFQYFEPRIYIESHILLGICSLIPFIVGHRASLIRANHLRKYLLDNERTNITA